MEDKQPEELFDEDLLPPCKVCGSKLRKATDSRDVLGVVSRGATWETMLVHADSTIIDHSPVPDLEAARRERARAVQDLLDAERRGRIATQGKVWLESLVHKLEQHSVAPRIEWAEVPKLLHQLQAFVSSADWCHIHLDSWVNKSNSVYRNGESLRRTLHGSFERSTAIWVSQEITATVLSSLNSFPHPWHLEESDLPFVEGLAVLEEEFLDQDYYGSNMALSAISWHRHIKDGKIGIVCWMHAYIEDAPKNYPRLYFGWPQWIPFGESDSNEPLTWLCAAFLLMLGQPIVQEETHREVGGSKGKKGQKKRENAVTALTLRRAHRATELKEGESAKVDWQFRWVVTGHWRNQWYASEKRHKTIWIGAFTKGPDDKPLKTSERVYRWVR